MRNVLNKSRFVQFTNGYKGEVLGLHLTPNFRPTKPLLHMYENKVSRVFLENGHTYN